MDEAEMAAVLAYLSSRPWPLEIADRRAVYDSMGDTFSVAEDVEAEPASLGGVAAEWTRTPQADHDRVIVYLHGGGYVYGSIKSHRHLASEFGRAARARCVAVDYRLAPEHPFPAALDDVLAVVRALVAGGTDPRRLALVGDSAGGGLAVAAMVALRDEGLPQPACALLLSPFTDMEASGSSFEDKADEDPAVKKATIEFVARAYLNGRSPRTPLASPIHADLRGIAPLMILVGSTEVLMDDSMKLARAAAGANVSTRLEVWPGMVHIWPTYHRILGAGRQAIAAGADFIRHAMDAPPPGTRPT